MSDSSQTIVGVDVSEAAAAGLGARIVERLVARGIVETALTDCVMTGVGRGPGPRAGDAVEGSTEAAARIRDLRTNGMRLAVGRQVFDTGGNGLEVRCEACGEAFEPGDGYAAAAGAWFEGDDGAAYTCDRCGVGRLVREWDGDWAWALGCLGFEFWNWPSLRGEFVGEVAAMMGGRVRLVRSRV